MAYHGHEGHLGPCINSTGSEVSCKKSSASPGGFYLRDRYTYQPTLTRNSVGVPIAVPSRILTLSRPTKPTNHIHGSRAGYHGRGP